MIKKNNFKLVGKITAKAIFDSAKFHLSRKEIYMTMGAAGIGGAIGSKNITRGIQVGFTAGLGVISCGAMYAVPRIVDSVMDNEDEIKIEDD